MASSRCNWLGAAHALAASVAFAQGAGAHDIRQGEVRSVAGRVLVARAGGRQPVRSAWVTLHRIGPDTAAPLDSMRTGAGGDYAFRYRTAGDTSAVYIVSGMFAGIAYFSAPLTRARTAGGDADLVVYDTASVGVPVTIESRHVVVAAPGADGTRRIVEVFVLANASDRTRVADARTATFSATLPPGATDARPDEGDVSPEAVTFAGGRVQVTAPIAPGTRRVGIAYRLPKGAEAFGISGSDSAALVEIVVEDSAATVTGNGVREAAPTSVAGRTFRRFVGLNVASTAALRITAPSGSGAPRGTVGVVVLGIAVAMSGVLALTLRRGAPLLAPDSGRQPRLADPAGTA